MDEVSAARAAHDRSWSLYERTVDRFDVCENRYLECNHFRLSDVSRRARRSLILTSVIASTAAIYAVTPETPFGIDLTRIQPQDVYLGALLFVAYFGIEFIRAVSGDFDQWRELVTIRFDDVHDAIGNATAQAEESSSGVSSSFITNETKRWTERSDRYSRNPSEGSGVLGVWRAAGWRAKFDLWLPWIAVGFSVFFLGRSLLGLSES